MTEILTNLSNDINLHLQKAKWTPNWITGRNPHRVIIKFLKNKDKEKNLESTKVGSCYFLNGKNISNDNWFSISNYEGLKDLAYHISYAERKELLTHYPA